MAEYGIYDLASGGRRFTVAEQNAIEENKLTFADRIRIMEEKEPDYKDDGAPPPPHLLNAFTTQRPIPATVFRPVQFVRAAPAAPAPAAAPAAAVAPVVPAAPVAPVNNFNEQINEQKVALAEYKRQLDEQKLVANELVLDRALRRNREYDYDLYNRLYHWGIAMVPDHYTYTQRERLTQTLSNLIKSELLMRTPEYALENLIRKIVTDENAVLDLTHPKSTRAPARRAPRKVSQRSKRASKKTPKKVPKKAPKKASKKTAKKAPKKAPKKTKK
jgi:hypothetical protein